MGNKFPRPKDVNFPSCQNPKTYLQKIKSERKCAGKSPTIGTSISLLQSGNILVSYYWRDEDSQEFKSALAIYKEPWFTLVEKYVFENEVDDAFYYADCAIQLKNGNIFSICDRLYIFDGESIKDGTENTSEQIDPKSCETKKGYFEDVFDENVSVKKEVRRFLCDFMIDINEGNILYTYKKNKSIYSFNIKQLETKRKEIYSYKNDGKNYSLDIIHPSEYYPENLYIIANYDGRNGMQSVLLIFKLEDFCTKEGEEEEENENEENENDDEKNKNKEKKENKKPEIKPLNTLDVSNSQNVFAICEYDKKFLLLDTINNGIYIIDMESKQKVAVSVLSNNIPGMGKLENIAIKLSEKKEKKDGNNRFQALYREMIKLIDGQLVVLNQTWSFADIREQKLQKGTIGNSAKFFVCGNCIISLSLKGILMAVEFSDEKL